MTNRLALFCTLLIWLTIVAILNLAFIQNARAHHRDIEITINHDYPAPSPAPPEPYPMPATISTGVSDADLSRGIALAGAGQHQFTFDTLRVQGSVVGATYDDEQAIGLAIAKRFDFAAALWHGSVSFVNGGSRELWTVGATFRF